jgi:hypothetical protein
MRTSIIGSNLRYDIFLMNEEERRKEGSGLVSRYCAFLLRYIENHKNPQ